MDTHGRSRFLNPPRAHVSFTANQSDQKPFPVYRALYAYVGNDPLDKTDPTGNDTEVQLQSYIIGNAPIQGDYGHQYVYLRDTDTGEVAISRAGPSAKYPGGIVDVLSGSPVKNPSGTGYVSLITELKSAALSTDSNSKGVPLGTTVPGTSTMLKEPIGKAEATLQKFNKGVDSAKISYKPRSTNSNAYAGTAYGVLTGKTPPSSGVLPGSDVGLKPRIPMCTTQPTSCGGP